MRFFKSWPLLLLLIGMVAYGKDPTFDLGGKCRSEDPEVKLGHQLDYLELEKAKKDKNWNLVIEQQKISVRDGCSVPFRWKELLEALIGAKRFDDAVAVFYDMKRHEASISHFHISKLDKDFLNSSEFKKSKVGKDFFQETQSINFKVEQGKEKLKSMDPKLKPPALYVSKDNKCPFEYCELGKWKTTKTIKLLAEVRSSRVVEEIPKGTTVTALTGEVLKEPEPGVTLRDHGDIKEGEIIYILDYTGEGGMNVWYKGKKEHFLFDFNDIYEESAENDSLGGPLKKLYPERKSAEEWWVQIHTPSEITGWVEVLNDGEGQFDGPDGSFRPHP